MTAGQGAEAGRHAVNRGWFVGEVINTFAGGGDSVQCFLADFYRCPTAGNLDDVIDAQSAETDGDGLFLVCR